MTTWLVKKDGRMFGPFDVDQIRRLVESGKIDEDTLVRDGDSGPWELVSRVRGLLNDDAEPDDDVFVPPMLRSSSLDSDGLPGKAVPFESAVESDVEFRSDQSLSPPGGIFEEEFDGAAASTAEPETAKQKSVPTNRTPPPTQPTTGTVSYRDGKPAKTSSGKKTSHAPARSSRSVEHVSNGGSPAVAGLLSLLPGAGHLYLGMKQIGLIAMPVVLALYAVLWAGGAMIARVCINADAGDVAADTSFAGQLIADQSGSSGGMSLLVVAVVLCLCLPLLAHLGTAIHAVQSASE